jgi:hypothetical protein
MRPETYPLSFPQQAIFLDALLSGPSVNYNMGGGIVIRGPLDGSLFRRAVEFAFRQHDAQRMRVYLERGEMMQEFVEEGECSFSFHDFSGRMDPFQSAVDWVLADINRPTREQQFPLSGDVLFRLGNELHLWYPKFHHIANDACGHCVVARTIADGYNGLLDNGQLPELPRHSYVDFIRDDREYAGSDRFRRDAAFWRTKFASVPEPLPFTARKAGLSGDLGKTDQCNLGLHRLVYNALVKLCDEAGVTPFQFLLAVLLSYLYRVTGRDDIVIGTPILNRSNHAFRRTAGLFMNMMPLRTKIAGGTTVLGLASQISADLRTCYRHQRFPLSEILRHCRTLQGFGSQVFDVAMVYRKLDYDIHFGGSQVRTVTLDPQYRNETLSIEVDEYNAEEDVNIFFNYNPRLISREEAGQMARAFEVLLIDLTVGGDRRLDELQLAAETAEPAGRSPSQSIGNAVLDVLAQHSTEEPEPAGAAAPYETADLDGGTLEARICLLPDWISEHARRKPGSTALISGGVEISYAAARPASRPRLAGRIGTRAGLRAGP